MLGLKWLILIPLLFIYYILWASENYKITQDFYRSSILKYITAVRGIRYEIPYVLRKYYSHIISVKPELIPLITPASIWKERTENWREDWEKNGEEIKGRMITKIGLSSSLILYFILVLYWLQYNRGRFGYQLFGNLIRENELWNLDVLLGIDSISLPFVLLTVFIFPIVYLSNWSTTNKFHAYYIIIIIGLELFLIIVFLVVDLIMFYIFFESTLPLLFVLIGLYGAAQKFRAGYYLFLYTLFGSLFMLLSFVKVGGDTGINYFEAYTVQNSNSFFQEIIWIILFVSFSVKTPLIPVHIWLPLAHSDANVSGSIILASIVLKLALYGFLRILIGLFVFATLKLIPFFFGLCSISVLYSSFTTIRQFDLKVLVAYSSIAHMASSLLGTFSDTLYGIIGSVIFGLAHGFVSPGLFLIVGAVLYDRAGTRIINYYRGLNVILPFVGLLFLILVFGNMGVPLTGNFIGEFLSLLGAYQQNIIMGSVAALSVVLSAVYSIYMYNRVTSGSLSPYVHIIPDFFRKEVYSLGPLLILTLLLGIYPYFISGYIEFGLSNLLLGNILIDILC